MHKKVRNTHIHLTQELRGEHLTNKCVTCDARVNGFFMKAWRNDCHINLNYKTTRGLSKIEMYQGDNSFEIDIVLFKKPPTNVFEYTISTKGLDFHYQSPLTEKEKEQGCVRPDNVVGSYAVYRKDKKRHNFKKHGIEINYGTGKFGHIFRPKAIDTDDNEIWCDLYIDQEKQILTITVPQSFLDTARYPVRIDPEFGTHSHGASSLAQDDSSPIMFLNPADQDGLVLSGANATITELWFYGSAIFSNVINSKMAVYKKEATVANSLLTGTSDTLNPSGTTSWQKHTANILTLDGNTYIIGIVSDYISGISSWGNSVYYDTVTGSQRNTYTAPSPGTPPDPLGVGTPLSGNQSWSLYGVYEEEAIEPVLSTSTDLVQLLSNANIVRPLEFTFASPAAAEDVQVNFDAFDIKLKHICDHRLSSGTYRLPNCPRCLGTGYYYDIKFNAVGRPFETQFEDKLRQALEKFMITEENRFHFDVAANIQKWLGALGNRDNLGIIKDNIIRTLVNLQEIQKTVSNLSARAKIATINTIVTNFETPGVLRYNITLTTVSGEEKIISGTIALSDLNISI